jgi:lipopolysaccharide transport system ATP-binding protein
MDDIAITASGLAKKYRIGASKSHGLLGESIWNAITGPFSRKQEVEDERDFWALRDVSFEVPRGSVLGVIGRNGAGKSTLLKILTRITTPTLGRAELRGRVGSLLEVGTGFHQELTGRENVLLSGAILGMKRAEILRKFDEIVAFANIGQFIDVPVKRYSSGMKVRLGFAVAAFLEPEILLIDEVLAVGDSDFQKKCLGKMSEIGQGGRTIVFVSHSMPAIQRLCDRAILLDHGRVIASGPTNEVTRRYLESNLGSIGERRWDDPAQAPGDDVARLRSVRIKPAGGGSIEEVDIRLPVDIEVEYWSKAPGKLRPTVNIDVFNDDGVCLFSEHDWNNREWRVSPRRPGLVRSTCHIPGNFLAEGRMVVTVVIGSYNPTKIHLRERDAVAFHVVDQSEGDGVRADWVGDYPGVVRPLLDWSVEVE